MHPIWNGDGSDVARLSAQVYDCPMAFTLLQVTDGELGEFVAAKSAGEQ